MSSTKYRGQKAPLPAKRSPRFGLTSWLVVLTVAVSLVGLYSVFTNSSASKRTGTALTYDVARPGPGQVAPPFTLTDNTGRTVSLDSYRGKNVLLYFHEGLTCPPCWDQLTVLENEAARVKAAGVDAILSVTTDPADLIGRKTRDMGISTPVLSDPDMAISRKYEANRFGMMGESRDGHTFILVGPEGVIRWRADYGGPPTYTMFVPVDRLLTDLQAGLKA